MMGGEIVWLIRVEREKMWCLANGKRKRSALIPFDAV